MKKTKKNGICMPQRVVSLLSHAFRTVQRPVCVHDVSEHSLTKPPDHSKETQSAVIWSCLLFIRSGQKHFARHSERGKKTRQTEEEVGR